jgi:hydrogenase maturation protease
MLMKTIVIGLGNPILTDDGVGVLVAYEVSKILALQKRNDIEVTEASVGGIRLMELMVGFNRAILVDAIISNNGRSPGRIRKMSLDDLCEISPTQHSTSSHDTSITTALDMGRKLGLKLPDEIVIYAIEVENIIDFNENPTSGVANAIPRATKYVLDEIGKYPN